MNLFDNAGRKISLGKRLGSGGEGTVYSVLGGNPSLVAKVYHKPIPPEKQAKLRDMANGCDESLKKISAWPLATLHTVPGNPVIGFLMPMISGFEPIHQLYNPGDRKRKFPNVDWAFLVYTARNVAAAFDAIHTHGHLIGDVNPNLVHVAADSVVKLIDCDSFQIVSNGRVYLCEVGVPHFTPPELQTLSSFHGVRREKNHDNFGLALLVFHILLMGRHPFSGVWSGAGDMPLEKAIASYRYAYGDGAGLKGVAPPPKSVTPAILPREVARLFETAFSERQEVRPSARAWTGALETLRGQLRVCSEEPSHKYYAGLSDCPWCSQESVTGVSFFISCITVGPTPGGFDLARTWAAIRNVGSPGPAPAINLPPTNPQGRALPPELVSAKREAARWKIKGGFVAVIFVVVVLLVARIPFLPWGGVISLIGFVFYSIFSGLVHPDDSHERGLRAAAIETARQASRDLDEKWKSEASDAEFQAQLLTLSKLRDECERLASQLDAEKQRMIREARDVQLRRFLEGKIIAAHSIPDIGAKRKTMLAARGIRTAADITPGRIGAVPGFGEALTMNLIGWRKYCEQGFKFDSSVGLDPASVADLNVRFVRKLAVIQRSLLRGPQKLSETRDRILAARGLLEPRLREASMRLAQAKADYAELG